MTLEEIAELKKRKQAKLKSLNLNFTGGDQKERITKGEGGKLVAYKINISIEDREFLNDYIYAMTQRTGQIYRMTDGVRDAIKSLRDNCTFNIPPRLIK